MVFSDFYLFFLHSADQASRPIVIEPCSELLCHLVTDHHFLQKSDKSRGISLHGAGL